MYKLQLELQSEWSVLLINCFTPVVQCLDFSKVEELQSRNINNYVEV